MPLLFESSPKTVIYMVQTKTWSGYLSACLVCPSVCPAFLSAELHIRVILWPRRFQQAYVQSSQLCKCLLLAAV